MRCGESSRPGRNLNADTGGQRQHEHRVRGIPLDGGHLGEDRLRFQVTCIQKLTSSDVVVGLD
jgi:hypothetical protein